MPRVRPLERDDDSATFRDGLDRVGRVWKRALTVLPLRPCLAVRCLAGRCGCLQCRLDSGRDLPRYHRRDVLERVELREEASERVRVTHSTPPRADDPSIYRGSLLSTRRALQ